MQDTTRSLFMAAILSAAFLGAACSSDKDENKGDDREDRKESSQAQVSGGTGDTIIVEMHSDALGNYYKPNDIEAESGDIVRFVLKSGVHNVHFLADSNEIKTGLPPASEMLQLPDQTYDLLIDQKEGHYYFQCDPHAALGMKGRLEVED